MYIMSNITALDITEIEQQQRRVMTGLDRLRDDDEVESHRKTFLRIATPSRTHLDSGDIGFFMPASKTRTRLMKYAMCCQFTSTA